jgi:hypothetical protein
MAKVQLFLARKGVVVISDVEQDGEIIVRDDLTPAQAKAMAARLNNTTTDTDFQATHREQKFSIDIVYHTEVIAGDDDGWTVKDVKWEVEQALSDFVPFDGDIPVEKFKVTVKKLYDKQVPND